MPEHLQALAGTLVPEMPPGAAREALGKDPAARFAAIEQGHTLRERYVAPEKEASLR